MGEMKKEPIYLAIVSGKGGSGKTTLALSLAALISKCKKTVLLFDCDSVTNGATYFFEKSMNLKSQGICTTEDYLYHSHADESKEPNANKSPFFPVVIPANSRSESYFGFVPSIARVTKEYSQKTGKLSFKEIEDLAKSRGIDIVIFDCQAGYSEATKFLLAHASIKLVVLEADAISISAIRVLQAKLQHALERKTTYQIMNKVQQEEYDLYSGDRVDLLFPNLNPIIFDWSIRECFAKNKLPTIGVSNFRFSIEICDLACALFPTFKSEFTKVKLKLLSDKKRSVEDALSANEAARKKQMRADKKLFIAYSGMLLVLLASIYYLCTNVVETCSAVWGVIAVAVFVDLILALAFIKSLSTKNKEETFEYRENEDLLRALNSQIAEMESEPETYKETGAEDD